MKYSSLWIVLFLISLMSHGWSQELGESAQNLIKSHKKAVISIYAVLKFSLSIEGANTQSFEMKREFTGFFIDPKGLVVTSVSNISADVTVEGADPKMVDMKIEVLSAKMILSDGKEIDAKVILRDKDLDLAFFMPAEKTSSSFPYISLEGKKVKSRLLERVFFLSRMEKAARRVLGIEILRINYVAKKPRPYFYSKELEGAGGPVFNKDGILIGLALKKKNTVRKSSFFVILPPNEISESVKQAKAAMEE